MDEPALVFIGIVFDTNSNETSRERFVRGHLKFVDRIWFEIVFVVIVMFQANIFGRLILIVEQLNVDGRRGTRFDMFARFCSNGEMALFAFAFLLR